MELIKGGNIALNDAGVLNVLFTIGMSWNRQFNIDASAFLVDENGKVTNDTDFIFYNQPQSPCGAVRFYSESNSQLDCCTFTINILRIPVNIQRIVFALSTEATPNSTVFNRAIIRICDNNSEYIRYQLNDSSNESSVIMGELYRNKAGFKFRAVGQGFNDGLGALAQHFGVDIGTESNEEESATLKRKPNEKALEITRHANELRKKIVKFLPKINSAIESSANESNTRMILDQLFLNVLNYDIDEVKAEQFIQGRRADYVLSVDDQDVIVVEAKKAGMALRDKQIFQATSYAAYSGIRWALLTNVVEWQLYRVSTQEKVEADLIFAIKLSAAMTQQDIEKLTLLSRAFMNHKNDELEKLWHECNALSGEAISGILLTDDIISNVRNVIKRDSNCDVTNDQIRVAIEQLLNLN
jgi:stress response protein SCP2